MTALQVESGRDHALRRARLLNRATIGWNAIEGVVAVAAGIAAGSVSLVGFGLDSGIEVSAALVLTWRLANDGDAPRRAVIDRRAQRGIAVCFAALAAYVVITSVLDVAAGRRPEESMVGIAIAVLSLLVMPALARAKRRSARELGSRAAVAEADQTDFCTMLSAALLVGLAANAAFGWWWADSIVAVGIGVAAAILAVRTWNADSLADGCCG